MATTKSIIRPTWFGAVTIFALALPVSALAGPSDVTAVANNGTLEIHRAQGTIGGGSFIVDITLTGDLIEDISVFVDGALLATFPRMGISTIEIDADQSVVELGSFSLGGRLEFVGDIKIDVQTGGACILTSLDLSGDLTLRGSAGPIFVEYLSAVVDGDLTVVGGPGADTVTPGTFGGFLGVSGTLDIDGGSGNERIDLITVFVQGDSYINLGQNSGGSDADFCDVRFCQFAGSVMIAGESGDDLVSFNATDISGDLFVDVGNGADRVEIRGLSLSLDSLLFLEGGNGTSDELSLNGFPISPNKFSGFEAVNP